MQLNTLKPKTARYHPSRVGRGGKRGKTSGRGQKGAGSRAGSRQRPELRDTIKKFPKLRGHGKNRARGTVGSRVKPSVVNLAQLELYFDAGTMVNPATLLEKKLVRRVTGRAPMVKILGVGDLSKALTFAGVTVSEKAKSAILKAGGTIE